MDKRLNKPRIVLADDNPTALRQIVALLAAEFDVVAAAENGQVALDYIRQHRPDVVVLDLRMPLLNGMEVMRELKKIAPGAAVVICSGETDPEIIEGCQQAGALGYVVKDIRGSRFSCSRAGCCTWRAFSIVLEILRPHTICKSSTLREGTLKITSTPSKGMLFKFL